MTASVAGELIRTGHSSAGCAGRLSWSVRSQSRGLLALHRAGGPAGGLAPLRVVGLILVLGSGFAFDDAAAPTLQASPYPLVRRMWLRIGCAAALVVPLWSLALVRMLPSAPTSQSAGAGVHQVSLALGLTVELLAALAVVWATAAWGRRRGFVEPGIATAPVLLGLLYLAVALPRTRLLVGSGWLAAHLRWAAVLGAAVALLAHAMRDPAARRWRSHRPRRSRRRRSAEEPTPDRFADPRAGRAMSVVVGPGRTYCRPGGRVHLRTTTAADRWSARRPAATFSRTRQPSGLSSQRRPHADGRGRTLPDMRDLPSPRHSPDERTAGDEHVFCAVVGERFTGEPVAG